MLCISSKSGRFASEPPFTQSTNSMTKHLLSLTLAFALGATAMGLSASAQATKPADVYPSNLEENMYFEKYEGASNTVKGLHFMVLSDGNNSKDRTPEFNVKLYLYQEG